eukprot:1280119-Prymnesium_polylepis.1
MHVPQGGVQPRDSRQGKFEAAQAAHTCTHDRARRAADAATLARGRAARLLPRRLLLRRRALSCRVEARSRSCRAVLFGE